MGTGEGRARSRSWFFTEKLVNGLMERSGRFWGRFIWGRISLWWSCVNCGGGDCSPGSGWLAGPMVCRRPPCAARVPRVPRLRVHLRGGQRGQRRPAARHASCHPLLRGARAQQQLVHGRQVVTLVLRHARPHRRRALEVLGRGGQRQTSAAVVRDEAGATRF